MRGFVSGLFWGAIASVLTIAVVSLVTEVAVQTAGAPQSQNVEVPAGSEFNRNRPETRPVIPEAEEPATIDPAPEVGAADTESAPATDTAAAAAPTPDIEAPDSPEAPEAQSDGQVALQGTGTDPDQSTPSTPTLSAAEPVTETVPTAPSMPQIIQPNQQAQTEVEEPETPEQPVAPAQPTESDGEQTEGISLPTITEDTPVDDSVVAVDPEEVTTEADEPAEDADTDGEVEPPQLGAIARHSAPFDLTASELPLFAVVLIDLGEPDGLERETLLTFSFPITIAIDPRRPDAGEAADAYRAAGHEVLILMPPTDAYDGDISATIADAIANVPQAVGIVDADAGGFQGDRDLVSEAVEVLASGGHGMLTYSRGLNSAQQIADREGLPAATIFRALDVERENPTTIKRYLDRAAFKAGQDGQVVMIGRSYPDTVTALFSWALERVESVRIAPVSAVFRQ